MSGAAPQDWARFVAQGLTHDLLPVVSDTTIPISPQSRVKQVGKTPSIVNREGFVAGLAGWTATRATANQVRQWSADTRLGVCIQTREVRALDVDIDDSAVSAEVRALVEMTLGDLPCRWRSNSGKLLLAFRLPGAFTKRKLATAHGAVEFLATGQQFIAAGTHTSGARYQWSGPDEIPEITADEFESVWLLLAQVFGVKADSGERTATSHDGPVLGLTENDLRACLAPLDPDMSYDKWVSVGMALHHETRGQGMHLWVEFSERGSEYPGADELESKWEGFGRNTAARAVTAASLIKMAQDAGGAPQLSINGPASPEEFEMAEDAPAKGLRFVFEPVHSFAKVKPAAWIVKGVLPQAGLAVMYGASGSGKSFAALDLAMAVARGVEWRQRRVKQGPVAYIAAEGADGFRKRVVAYAQRTGVDLESLPLTVLNGAPNLMLPKDADDISAGALAVGRPSVVIVDTLAQTTPGADENAAEDMGKALGHCRRIHQATGALVLLIHHSGKDQTKGARGWSGLRAACDAELEVLRDKDGCREMRLTKNKDGEDGLRWGFRLEIVEVGVDEDNDPVTSCVVEEADINEANIVKALGKNETVVNDVIQEFAKVQTSGIEVKAVIEEAARRMMEAAGLERDPKGNCKGNARRALKNLVADDAVPYFFEDDGATVSIA